MASSANHLCCSGESKSNTSFGSSPVEKTPQANLSRNLSQNKVSSACRLRAAECCKHLLIDVWFAALSWKWGKERAVCYSLVLAGSHGLSGHVQPPHTGPSPGSCGCSHQQAEVEIQPGGTALPQTSAGGTWPIGLQEKKGYGELWFRGLHTAVGFG